MDTVILLTSTYPYGKGEEFIENEIKILAEKSNKVIVIAMEVNPAAQTMRETADNVTPFRIDTRVSKVTKLKKMAFNVLNILSSRNEAYKSEIRKRKKIAEKVYLLRMEERSLHIWNEIVRSGTLKGLEKDSIIIYSYWLYLTARVGAIIKEQSGLDIKFMVSRAHGYDLYEERSPVNYLPYRNYFFNMYDLIAPCSRNGAEYLTKMKNMGKASIATSYLGTHDYGIKQADKSETLYIVSCSSLVPLKRVNRIASALRLVGNSININWTHIGSGTDYAIVERTIQQLPSNVKVSLLGILSNPQVMSFYANEPVDLFVNVSSTEGLPVSIMEALSFGIPVVCTNVGGTTELVQDGVNGYLLDKDFEEEELAVKIERFMDMKKNREVFEFRAAARSIWEKNFNAEVNYKEFWDKVERLTTELVDNDS